MTSLQVLLTGCALIGSGFAFYFAWVAGLNAEKAAHSEHRLSIMRGQVKGLEVAVVALDEQLNKLRGHVYVARRKDRQDELPRVPEGGECENWRTAQRDGPSSPAAGCECEYCNARRADRAQRRANLRAGVKT